MFSYFEKNIYKTIILAAYWYIINKTQGSQIQQQSKIP